MNEISRLLSDLAPGDPHAASRLLPTIYDKLRRLAAKWLSREQPRQALDATALVHEAYLRVLKKENDGGGGLPFCSSVCYHFKSGSGQEEVAG